MSRGMTGSALNAGMRPSLVAGNGGKGMIASSAQPGNIPQPVKSGQLWVDSFGNSRYKLGVLINSPGQFWNDLDLFQVTASNNMIISDIFIWKLVSTSAMNSITTILAPKVAVPNDIHTFTGRTMYYHVQPANDVPKRGTVRTMSKSMEEWVAHLSQKGMGSHIEGGALRTPQGKRFLDQEVIAIAWSIELNMVLNTVNTIINAAIVSSFNYSRQESPVINALSMGRALNREIEIFCSGCGTSRTLQALLAQYIETVPNADVLYMTNRLGSNLQFAGEIPGSDLPHKSYAMIPDENNVSVPVAIIGRNRTRTMKTIAGGTISVLAMPTFGFRGGESRYNPLEHDFTCGNHWVLNAERGLVPWDKLSVPNTDSKSSYYCSDMLNQDIYDHNLDRRERVDFKTAMKYAHVFNTIGDKYHFLGGNGSDDSKKLLSKLYSRDMNIFASVYKDVSVNSTNQDIISMHGRLSPSNAYIENILQRSGQELLLKTGMIVNESPISTDAGVKGGSKSNSSNDRVSFHEAVQRFKENVQFPLSRTFDRAGLIGQGLTKFKLPSTIGDLDPFHFLGVNFKSCVHDAKQQFADLFRSDQYEAFRELKRLLTTPRLNTRYWELVRIVNDDKFNLDEEGIKTSGKSYFGLSDYYQNKPHSAVPTNGKLRGWPLDNRTSFMRIPSYEEYQQYLNSDSVKSKKETAVELESEYVPQGMWSAKGLELLANPNVFYQSRINRLAESALQFLSAFSRKISEMFPFSTVSNARDSVGSLNRFLPTNTVISRAEHADGGHGVTSESDMQQIILSLFDDNHDMVAVSLKRPPRKDEDETGEGEEAEDFQPPAPETPFLAAMEAHVPRGPSHPNATELIANIYVQNDDGSFSKFSLHFSGPAWSFFDKNVDPEGDEDYISTGGLTSLPSSKSTSPPYHKLVDAVRRLLKAITPIVSRANFEQFKEKDLTQLLNILSITSGLSQDVTDNIVVHATEETSKKGVSAGFYLTPFTVRATQISSKISGIGFHNMHSLDTHDVSDVKRTKTAHLDKIATILPETNTTGWRRERIEEFVVNYNKKQWTALDRIISLFIIETQLSLPSADYWIQQGIRPYFEICLWRLFQRQRFEGLLLAKSGISTAMNPYNNAHIAMGVDATTDQYNVRAVIQTDCVVINSQNLAFIPCVSPTQYLGGRNTNFITSPDEIMNTDKDLDKIPSFISTIVSYGYMATTDYPLSFINNPPGRIANGFVTEVNMSTQFWPGMRFYYAQIYKSLFFSADKVYNNLKLDMNSDQHKSFVRWFRSQMDGNHVSTPGYSKCFDPMTNNYTYEIQGKGHYQYSYMNDSGARMVFEGVQPNFRIMSRIETSNT